MKAGRVLLVAYWAAMLIGTHLPPGPDIAGGVNDKVLHFAGYCGLAVLLVVCGGPLGSPWWRAVLVASLYGLADELTQPWFDRDADVLDWLADVAGSVVGAVAATAIRRPPSERTP